MKDFKWKRLAILLLCLLMCLSSALAEDSEAALPENVEIEGVAVDEEDSVSELDA